MRLEDGCDLLVFIEFADRQYALFDFRRMMGVVAQEDYLVILDLEIEPAVYTAEAVHSLSDLFVGHSVEVCKRHGGYAVFDVDAYRNSQLDIVDTGVGGNEIDEDFTVSDADVLCVEVALVARIGIDTDSGLHFRLQRDALRIISAPPGWISVV